jgi:hypothetical protein
MTRTTLKALWFGGGGVIATWIAVSPNHMTSSTLQNAPTERTAATAELTAEHLSAQTNRLRDRAGVVTLSDSTRNLFEYNRAARGARLHADRAAQSPAVAPVMPLTAQQPPLKLSGVAQEAGKRRAVISSGEQIYVVGEGDSFGGRYTVVKVDPEAVLIRDSDGAEHRVIFR